MPIKTVWRLDYQISIKYAMIKKRHRRKAMSHLVGVPGGTRTHDIQNHKQVVESLGTPVFIGISAFLHFAFAPILRRIFAELIFTIFQIRCDFLFS
jgi:hypothetical protein